jgi:hypothetical protein
VTVYDRPNFQGNSRALAIGTHLLSDFNDVTVSLRVPTGLVAVLYEHADGGGGYGVWADFLEDCADLTPLGFAAKASYVTVFEVEHPDGLVWRRNRLQDGQFVPGHWERKRARGGDPGQGAGGVVVAPPLPPHGPVVTGGGTPAVPDSATVQNTLITSLEPFGLQPSWDLAMNERMGVFGSDFRGAEEIGSAAFERASNNPVIPDFINFWYPQRPSSDGQVRDHRALRKQTLSGTVGRVALADFGGTYQDHDLNIDIAPLDGYRFMIDEGHPREYTDIMSAQWRARQLGLTDTGKPSCDDEDSRSDFNYVEAEIDTSGSMKKQMFDILSNSIGRPICVYGPWIYDKGHCCHPEIHPAEQIWWSDPAPHGRVYFLHLFCDESGRFWWRDQMDDGTKLKPWAEPPITGTFAIAFEATVNAPAIQYEISVNEVFNDVTDHPPFARHHLVYQGNTLVSVVQDPASPVRVTFENVGWAGGNHVRGFVVLEASVGKCTPKGNTPPDAHPSSVPEDKERASFTKEGGRLVMTVAQGTDG